MIYYFLGIAFVILHWLLWSFVINRKLVYLLASVVPVAFAFAQGKIGILFVMVSVLAILAVWFVGTIINLHENDSFGIFVYENSFMLISILAVTILLVLTAQFNANLRNTFESDVFNSYISTLYGTYRFSAVPLIEVSPFCFVLLTMLIYYVYLRKKHNADGLFASITITSIIYIFVIGYCYIHRWAADNIVQHGEYMTGVANHMALVVSMYYGFVMYSLISVFTRKMKLYDAKIGE